MLESVSIKPHRHQLPPVARSDQIKFYLKAGAVLLATTAVYAAARASNLLPNWRGSASTNSPASDSTGITSTANNAVVSPDDMKLVWLKDKAASDPSLESASGVPVMPGMDTKGLTDFQEVSLALPETQREDKAIQADKMASPAQRKLLSTPNEPVILANPIPDQIVQIGQTYTYDLSQVFSGDYFVISATGLPDWLNLEYQTLGSYSGSGVADALAVSGNTVFVSDGVGLQILDVSNLTAPRLLATYPAASGGVAVSGNTVFVADGLAGLQILDVSNLTAPQWLATTAGSSGYVLGVAVSGNTVFVADGVGLQILDVSNLTAPQWLATYPAGSGGDASGVAVSGNTVFVSDGVGLQILDVSNLTAPRLLNTYPYTAGGYANDLAVSGNTVFVANILAGLQILDVSNLTAPRLLATYPAGSGNAWNVAVSGNTAFVADGNAGLQILDVSNLTDPQLLGIYPVGSSGTAYGVAVSGNTVFVVDGNTGLQIPDLHSAVLTGFPLIGQVEIGQQWTITLVAQSLNHSRLMIDTFKLTVDNLPQLATYTLTDQSIFPSQSLTLTFQSDRLFSLASSSSRFLLHRPNNAILPAWLAIQISPTLLSTYPAGSGKAFGVVVSENTVFVADYSTGLQILDVSNLATPQLLAIYPAGSGGTAYGVAVLGNTVFVADGNAGLQILDVSNLTAPKLLATYSAGNATYSDVEVSGNTVFVADENVGLQILNVSNLTNPQWLATYPAGSGANGGANGVAVSGNTVFVADMNAGLQILDVSNLTAPRLLATYQTAGSYADDVAVSGNTVFVADDNAGLQILDVSNLTAPRLLATYPAGNGYANSLAVSGNTVFVADMNAGLQILDVSNLTAPQLLGTYPAGSGLSFGVAVSENTVFVADFNAGLQILSLSPWQLTLTANPSTADEGNYALALTATDPVGASISIPFTIRVEGPPRLNMPISSVPYAKVGQTFSYIVPSGTFSDPNLDPLVYAISPPNLPLPAWLSFDPISVTFVGTPTPNDVGSVDLNLIATDPLLAAAASGHFNITVVYPPEVSDPITQPLACVQNRNCTYQILSSTFDGHGNALSYSVTGAGANTLPSWLYFLPLPQPGTLYGIPPASGFITLSIVAENTYGDAVFTPLNILINPNSPPVVSQEVAPQTATVGQLFAFYLPKNTFNDPNGDTTTYTASWAPHDLWLTFDPQELLFKGKPTGADTNNYAVRALTVNLVAHDLESGLSTTLSFEINVGGNSYLATIVNYVATIFSLAISGYGYYKNRAAIWNLIQHTDNTHYGLHISHQTLPPDNLVRSNKIYLYLDQGVFYYRVRDQHGTLRTQKIAENDIGPVETVRIREVLKRERKQLNRQDKKAILAAAAKQGYSKLEEALEIGKPFSRPLGTLPESVASITVGVPASENQQNRYDNFRSHCCFFESSTRRTVRRTVSKYIRLETYDSLPGGDRMPSWMEYHDATNALRSRGPVPVDAFYPKFKVTVKDKSGFIQEEFNLNIRSPELEANQHVGISASPIHHHKSIELTNVNQTGEEDEHKEEAIAVGSP